MQDEATFLGVSSLPQPAVAGEVMNNVAAEDMVNDANYKLLRYVDVGTESAVDDFTVPRHEPG
jgi:hypothetical protein